MDKNPDINTCYFKFIVPDVINGIVDKYLTIFTWGLKVVKVLVHLISPIPQANSINIK